MSISFKAIIKELKLSRKSNEIDMESSIRLITEDTKIMALAGLSSDTVVDVVIQPEGENSQSYVNTEA